MIGVKFTISPIVTISLILIHLIMLTLVSEIFRPMLLAGVLLGSAVFTSLQLGLIINRWFFYFINLVFLGGVIVVVLFLCSVCSNNKFSSLIKISISQLGVLVVLRFLIRSSSWGGGATNSRSRIFIIIWLYQKGGSLALYFMVLRLLVCIIAVINIAKLDEGPMIKR